jgi:uncharacterized protein YfaS (alpha-2-macroglobulin family)
MFTSKNHTSIMRVLLFLFLFINSMAQAQSLETLWHDIEEGEKKGQFSSLMPTVEKAIALARENHNTALLAKGLLYKGKIEISSTESEKIHVFQAFETEIAQQTGLNKTIFQTLSAQLYHLYFSENRYRIINRTRLEDQTSDDPEFWSANTFEKKWRTLLEAALKNEDLLKKAPTTAWIPLLTQTESRSEKEQLELQPTLWDVIQHTAAEILDENERYKSLANYHLKNGNNNAYLFNSLLYSSDPTDLEKLRSIPGWFQREILRNLVKQYFRTEKYTEALSLIKTSPKDSVLQRYQEAIFARDFELLNETEVINDVHFPIQITHRNLNKLYVKVLSYHNEQDPLGNKLHNELNPWHKNQVEAYAKLLRENPTVSSYEIAIKEFKDYKRHSGLYALKPLKTGRYVVLFSEDPQFSLEKPLKYVLLKVSPLKLLQERKWYLLNRNTGVSESKKKVQIYSYLNDKLVLKKTLSTNAQGELTHLPQNNELFRVAGEPIFYTAYGRHFADSPIPPTTDFPIHVFTDRAIYRPGQTVWFKAIATKKTQKNVTLQRNAKLKVELLDPNYKTLSTLVLTTNEYGSAQGNFVLPPSALTGNFTLRVNLQTHHNFSVEEYKRPRFEVKMENPAETLAFEKEVLINGQATAYSGAQMQDATVTYTVYRQALRYFRGPAEREEQIGFGSTKTDAEGKFKVPFIPSPAREKKDSLDTRTYQYRLVAEVTDLNGETQSHTVFLTVSDQKIHLFAELQEDKALKIKASNSNGIPVAARIKVKISKLKAPDRPLRKNTFQVDYTPYDRETFTKLLPYEPYLEEEDPTRWPLASTLLETEINAGDSLRLPAHFEGGHFRIEMKAAESNVQSQTLSLPGKPEVLLSVKSDKKAYAPGEMALLHFNSTAKSIPLTVRIEQGGKLIKEERITVKNGSQTYKVAIKEHGQVWVHYFYQMYNSTRTGSLSLQVPYTHKKLEILTDVRRTTMEPGSKETWNITVKGTDKAMAEVLTGMYDASLDAFVPHAWDLNPHSSYEPYFFPFHFGYQNNLGNNTITEGKLIDLDFPYFLPVKFHLFNISFSPRVRSYMMRNMKQSISGVTGSVVAEAGGMPVEEMALSDSIIAPAPPKDAAAPVIVPRKALEETAFFFPQLRTDAEGNLSFSFTAPESLTEWKWMSLAHTPDLKTGYLEQRIKTQKKLMVTPNFPRFFREGDTLRFSAKIANLSGSPLQTKAWIRIQDALTDEPLEGLFQVNNREQTVQLDQSTQVDWTLVIPKNISAVRVSAIASAGEFSDGEEVVIPVVSNRVLVTETLSLSAREGQEKKGSMEKLATPLSKTAENYKLTLELNANPIWNAIFALPYLREYPYECAEQVFSRLFANQISQNLVTSQPKIKAVFDEWNRKGQLKSKLEVNQELKNILLEETPWVRDAVEEEEQQKRIGLLFEMNNMQNERQQSLEKLEKMQLENGAFPWFSGGPSNFYISAHILSGFGTLAQMNAAIPGSEKIIEKLTAYLDQEQAKELKKKPEFLSTYSGLHYLYARSFFLKQYPLSSHLDTLKDLYLKKIDPKTSGLQSKALQALVLHRYGRTEEAKKILFAVKEQAVQSEELGMYWKANSGGMYSYQAPIETQALLIEAFSEINRDLVSVESMKVWLLKNKQATHWPSTKSTLMAVKVLLQTGKVDLNAEQGVRVQLGDYQVQGTDAVGGQFKKAWNKEEITPSMAQISLQKTSPGVAWANLYWQYFEDMDKVTRAANGVSLKKKLYLKTQTAEGEVLREITKTTPIKLGDRVTVRLEITCDRDMEFIHIKDLRAAGFEPVNTLSSYKRQDGLGYYESTRDVATHFFADYMPKGKYVFTYDLRANNGGEFSNGITQLQNMYAPEFSTQSEGIRVKITF